MQNFRKLRVWQNAHDFSLRAEKLAGQIRKKKPRIANQLERAANSVPALISEGRRRATDADFAHYVSMAIGEITECENHLVRAFDGGLISKEAFDDFCERAIEIRKMSIGLRTALRRSLPPPQQRQAVKNERRRKGEAEKRDVK